MGHTHIDEDMSEIACLLLANYRRPHLSVFVIGGELLASFPRFSSGCWPFPGAEDWRRERAKSLRDGFHG